MEHNKAPGPDGFLAEFYQHFWDIIKPDLLALFNEFHQGTLPLHCLNFGIITLLPKKTEATTIQQYRPICLLNVSFKIFTKVLTNRINLVAQKVIRSSQTAFLPGRYIIEGAVVLHETIHELHKRKKDGFILKLDFEKAYNKVKWPFLQQVLRMKGFSPRWASWIQQVTLKRSVGIKVNDNIKHYFQTKKGVRQGDPLSPIFSILW
jgi:mannosylglycoprotein endo-beta-mannosidase